MKIIFSIIIGLILMLPTLTSIVIFNKKKQLRWLYGGISLTLIATIIIIYIILEIRLPSNSFSEKSFKEAYTEVFQMKLPDNFEMLKKEYQKEAGLFGHEIWSVRISFDDKEYLKLLSFVKKENEMLLKDYTVNPLTDCETGNKIIYSIKTNYMNPWNYNLDFFEDKKTINMTITIYGN